MLLKKYKNRLFKIIGELSVSERAFTLDDFVGENLGRSIAYYKEKKLGAYLDLVDGFIISYKNTDIVFLVNCREDDLHSFYCQSNESRPGFPLSKPYKAESPGDMESYFKMWLKQIVSIYISERNEIDLWEQYRSQNIIGNTAFTDKDLEPFSIEEKETIKNCLDKFYRLLLIEFSPIKEDIEIINEKLDYLKQELDSLNKYNWRAVLFNVVFTISIQLSLSKKEGELLWNFLKTAFKVVKYIIGSA